MRLIDHYGNEEQMWRQSGTLILLFCSRHNSSLKIKNFPINAQCNISYDYHE